ncbi:MAG: diguanylate cyclase [Lysobacterales bacterium]
MAVTALPAHRKSARHRLSIGRRLFYTHLLVALLAALGLGTYMHWAAESELRQALRSRLTDNARLAGQAISVDGLDLIRSVEDAARPESQRLQQSLRGIADANSAIARLLVVRVDGPQLVVVADSFGAVRGYSPGDTLAAASWVAGPRFDAVRLQEASSPPSFNAAAALGPGAGTYGVLLAVSIDDINSKLYELRRNSAISFILAVVLALAMSMYLAVSARRVLQRFAARFREIAEGRLDHQLDLRADDEFADLAAALNDMSARLNLSQREREDALGDLKGARDRLEEMVRQRSAELEKLNVMLRSEIEQRCQLEAALAEAAATDTMTRLLNRRGMLEALEHTAEQARRQKSSFIVVIGDIDHFKRINDQYGHSVGDQVLIALGRKLKASLKNNDAAGRWGGEEFLLLWAGQSITEAERRCNELRQSLGATPIYPNGPQITVSFGVAEFTGLETLDRCINRADKALYRAKMEGRNRVCAGV